LYRLLRFFYQNQSALTPLFLLFRKRSRSAHLLGCKRPRDGSLSLLILCCVRRRRTQAQNSDFTSLIQKSRTSVRDFYFLLFTEIKKLFKL